MPATAESHARLLLDLLNEADDHAVSLGELEVVGVADPARELRRLELAGHAFERVYELPSHGGEITCVRLAPARATPAASAPPQRQTAAIAAPDRRPLVVALLALVLLGLAALVVRRR
jgi:hypothetical protein